MANGLHRVLRLLSGGRPVWAVTMLCLWFQSNALVGAGLLANAGANASASATDPGTSAAGAVDGDRFNGQASHCWRGRAGASNWWWEIGFDPPRPVGAILQVSGDHEFVLRHAPARYVWQVSVDGTTWRNLNETRQEHETRCFRLHRLKKVYLARAVRIQIDQASDAAPALREVEFYGERNGRVDFPDWIVAVNTTDDSRLPGHGREFIPLARRCDGFDQLQAQQIWLDACQPDFVAAEPRPLCLFLSGNFKDWCEVDRSLWRGLAALLQHRQIPMWASCGGAQGLAILAETGVERPWDCPHCRDPRRPLLPIYTHIGHTTARPCGDYSGCVFERGPHEIRVTRADPVFSGLPSTFRVMESHCGQIEWAPKGWELIATAGPGTLTRTQCLRRKGSLIYAAQFHIEMEGTPEVSRQIMGNFLQASRRLRRRRGRRRRGAGRASADRRL